MQTFIHRHLCHRTLLSYCLLPFSAIYCAIVCLRRSIYRLFPALVFKAQTQIISVGNLIAGGSGKTPFVLYLAKEMQEQGKMVAIVLRGYKSGSEHKNTLVSPDNIHTVGDEAAMYAHNLPDTPICVGKNRKKSIIMLQKKHPDLDCIIMDDSFQHLSVYADTTYCLFNTINPIGNGFCLPAGLLREPLSTLKYTDFIVINGDSLPPHIYTKLQTYQKPIINCTYTISAIKDTKKNLFIAVPFDISDNVMIVGTAFMPSVITFKGLGTDGINAVPTINGKGNCYNIEYFKDKKIMLLSGIGLPQSFENTVSQAGITFAEHIRLTDHFLYTKAFFEKMADRFSHYDCILTTEKDYTKIQQIQVELPLYVVYVCLKVQGSRFENT